MTSELHMASSSLREKCPYLELFWPVFSHIRTEYGEIQSIFAHLDWIRTEYFPYSVQMRENTDQNNP